MNKKITLLSFFILSVNLVFSNTSTLETDYLKVIYCTIDSVFTKNLGERRYSSVRTTLKFALIIKKDKEGVVTSCNYHDMSDEKYEAIIQEVCNAIVGLNFSGYFDEEDGFSLLCNLKAFDYCGE